MRTASRSCVTTNSARPPAADDPEDAVANLKGSDAVGTERFDQARVLQAEPVGGGTAGAG